LSHSLIRLNSLVKHVSFVGAKHSIHRSPCYCYSSTAVVQVGAIIKKFQVTNKTRRGALTFSGGGRGTAPKCPPWLRACWMLNVSEFGFMKFKPGRSLLHGAALTAWTMYLCEHGHCYRSARGRARSLSFKFDSNMGCKKTLAGKHGK
jgi:hypothetical protein